MIEVVLYQFVFDIFLFLVLSILFFFLLAKRTLSNCTMYNPFDIHIYIYIDTDIIRF